MLYLYNTAKKAQEAISPGADSIIRFYACGPTVYQRASIGNLRAYVMEDILRRTLENIEGFHVKHVVNITDVGHLTDDADSGEDKLEKESKKIGESAWDISKKYAEYFLNDLQKMNILLPTAMPKATEHIHDQIELISILEEKGVTYKTSDGIYFDTSKVPQYGKLSGQKLEEKKEGARVSVNQEKRNASDFALWKFSNSEQKRQMEWESPWGIGFPGWHIECSAMSRKELGQPIDIHAGGVDHIPVHHENEIAQSETAFGIPYVHVWMHVEFLTVDNQKMSKSLGNTYSLDDLQEKGISPMGLRLFFLGAHYRSKQNFTWDAVKGAQNAYEKMCRIVRSWELEGAETKNEETGFKEALENDLNTPEALAILWRVLDSDLENAEKVSRLRYIDAAFGLGLAQLIGKKEIAPDEIIAIADERKKAREEKDWALSDELRESIDEKGWVVLDTPDGYRLEKKEL